MNQRVHIIVRGAVQGVGFRPFVYRLAAEMALAGWVLNSPQGVSIEVEGPKSVLDAFILRLDKERPPRSFIQSMEFSFLDPLGYVGFEIRHSDGNGEATTLVLPDIATCSDCQREIFDPKDRRHLYPFTNCTNCGPRFTIIEALPYDRASTSMRGFEMCESCRREYEDPLDRRFHAQPNACPECGPRLQLWDEGGSALRKGHEALCAAAEAIRQGRVVAVKGLGGFHLLVDASSDRAVATLRRRKSRDEKPFALMAPGLEAVRECCQVSALEERLLLSPEAPIVLLRSRNRPHDLPISSLVAPRNPYRGVMLPYTPLHHLLVREVGSFVVATSGNLADEPICVNEYEAIERLRGIADLFLVHNRPIVRHADDSVARVMLGRELVLRRARGYAPLPVRLKESAPPLIAVGAQLKNSVAISSGPHVFISQHIGDLETEEAFKAFQNVIESLRVLYGVKPSGVICDLHPRYLSTQFARECGLSLNPIQHHHAHVAACKAENELTGRVLGVAWDGTGYGPDGTVWGGEFLLSDGGTFDRVASLRPFRLPGGERAIREPRRSALSILYEILGAKAFDLDLPPHEGLSSSERSLFHQMLKKGVNSPFTSSVGRLFDAVSSLLGLCQRTRFEGQAAMELEFLLIDGCREGAYPFAIHRTENQASAHGPLYVADWAPLVRELLGDLKEGISGKRIAARFHNALVEMIVEVAKRIGEPRVVLTGGCFQNKYLSERAVARLREEKFRAYWHQRVPPNDGGIALGQVYAWLEANRHGVLEMVSEQSIEEKRVAGGAPCA